MEISFVSEAEAHLPPSVLTRIRTQSCEFNARRRITGTLSYRDGIFRQTLEGDPAVIVPLSALIFADPRHFNIRIEAFAQISCRRYSDWTTSGLDLSLRRSLRGEGDWSKVSPLLPGDASRTRRGETSRKATAKLLRF